MARLAAAGGAAAALAAAGFVTVTPGAFSASPSPPAEPRAAQVYAIFEAACAGCHQVGKLTGPAPAGQLANIQSLGEIAAEPHLVRPGEPDASRLYHTLLDRHRPFEQAAQGAWPSAAEIQRVRTWIEELGNAKSNCPRSSDPIGSAAVATAIDAAVREAGEAVGRDLRFVTLAHLANACVGEPELEGYREAVAKLLNSLSWGLRPVTLKRIDPAGSILAFRLSDIGWIAEHWSTIAAAEPAGVALDLTGKLSSPSGDTRPIRGDWLAAAVRESPLYDELLGLPPTIEELFRLLGINRDAEIGTAKAPRAAVRSSLMTRGPRVFERFQADTRRIWLSYDAATGAGDRDVFDRPLGYIRSAPERWRFQSDGLRAIFTLPNGFLGYAAFDPDGRRLSEVPAAIETPASVWAGRGAAGCISCHRTGQAPFTDAMKTHLQSDKFPGPKEIKESALAIYGLDLGAPRDDDAFRFRRSMFQSGLDPDRMIHGLEPTEGLARRYRLDVDARALAAEAGLTVSGLEAAILADARLERSLVPRLRQGLITRPEANRVLSALQGQPPTATELPAAPLRLSLWTDTTRHKAGDLVTFHASVNAPCHLTLISVDPAGKATVLFPSEFEPDNLVRPGGVTSVPANGALYQFRLRAKGPETIVGVCQAGTKLPRGVEPDYERQRFTVLGSFENFERASFELETDAQQRASRPVERRSGQGRGQQRETKPEPSRPEASARAAIRIAIE